MSMVASDEDDGRAFELKNHILQSGSELVAIKDSIHNILFSLFAKRPIRPYTKLERLARDKHSSLLDSFISYKENEVL